MYSLFIDHPDALFSYKFLPGEKTGEDVVTRVLGIKATFVCNAFAKISKGDIYELHFDSAEDAIVFALKSQFPFVDKDKIDSYRKLRQK